MYPKIIVLFGVFLFWILPSHAQDKKAWNFYNAGMQDFSARSYTNALQNFDKYLERDSSKTEVYLKIAQIYEAQKNEPKASEFYKKLIAKDTTGKKYPQAYLYLGTRALEKNKFETAKSYLQGAEKLVNKNSIVYQQVLKQLRVCDFGIEALKHPLNIKPELLPETINAFTRQYFPVLTADNSTLFFTAVQNQSDENIYYSEFKNNEWQKPLSISENINTANNDGTCSISADGKIMVFTSCEGRESYGSCDLYISKKQGNDWSVPKNLGPKVNSKFWDSQPSLSPDGSKLFFSSERPFGFGKKDIWMSELNENDEWKTPINLGAKINTSDDEVSPFIHANGSTLFFASDGKEGMGKLDIYMCSFKNNLAQYPVLNLGYPINTMDDQHSLFITADGKKAYYSEEKDKNVRLYSFAIPAEMSNKFNKAFYLKGYVIDAKTQKNLYATIELIKADNGEKISTFQSDPITGDYMTIVPGEGKYVMYIETPDYLFKSINVDFTKSNKSEDLDIKLTKIEKETVGILNNIFFDYGSAVLRPESNIELERLYKLLKINPKLKIEVSGHTDDVGNDAFNMELSKKRATAVSEFLFSKGIAKDRIVTKGFGETKPTVKNDSEENRQLNRRIEFKFL